MINKDDVKKISKEFLKYALTFLSLILCFALLLTLTSLIPRNWMEKNVKESGEILGNQTNRLMIPIREFQVMFDNFTDALMINTAYSIDSSSPFFSSMVARKNFIPGKTKVIYKDFPGELVSASKYQELDQASELNDTVNSDIDESFEYARYWHGYLVLLRPLLCIMNIQTLRYFMIAVFSALAIFLMIVVAKKVNILSALAIRTSGFFLRTIYILALRFKALQYIW